MKKKPAPAPEPKKAAVAKARSAAKAAAKDSAPVAETKPKRAPRKPLLAAAVAPA